jgi:hypothetical protein
MKEIIKKILREYDELDWIDDITAEPVIVSKDNVYLGAKVRLNPESIYYRIDNSSNQLGYGVGEIILDEDGNLIDVYGRYNWVRVSWKTPNGDNKHQDYRVGPKDFDLMFAI